MTRITIDLPNHVAAALNEMREVLFPMYTSLESFVEDYLARRLPEPVPFEEEPRFIPRTDLIPDVH